MPYGMKGGDTPTSDKWMEGCVNSIKGKNKRTGKPYTKGEKIAICKAQYEKKKDSKSAIEIDSAVMEDVEMGMTQCIKKMLDSGEAKDESEAEAMCEGMLAKSNFVIKELEFTLNQLLNKRI